MSRHYYDEPQRGTGYTPEQQFHHLYPWPDAFTYTYGDPYAEYLDDKGLTDVTRLPRGAVSLVTTLAPGEPSSPPTVRRRQHPLQTSAPRPLAPAGAPKTTTKGLAMAEPSIAVPTSPFPIVTVTRNHDRMYLLLIDGEPKAGPYAYRESIDIVLEAINPTPGVFL